MKFDVSSTALLSRLQTLGKVIASKNTMPILDSFLFELKGNQLTITASDSDTRLTSSMEVLNAEGEGLFAISSKRLLEPLKELPEQPLLFEINDENMEIFIHYQNGKYNFIGQKGDAYPQQKPLSEDAMSFAIAAEILLSGINKTFFAMADDELRPVMNGVYFDFAPDSLTFVASDGHKLVRMQNKTIQTGHRASFILPKKPANLLKLLLAKDTEEVKVRFDSNSAYFLTSSSEMVCRLIEGRYPNYNSVIPKENPFKAVLDRIAFANALKRVSVFSNLATGLLKLRFMDNLLEISGQDIEFSTAAEETIVCQFAAEELCIGFKGAFLIDILNSISSEEIVFELADPTRPGVITPMENEADEELLMLLMPMMLNEWT